MNEAGIVLFKLNVLMLRNVVIERAQRMLVGTWLYVAHEWDFVLFEVEEGDEYTAFQLCDALDAKFGKPFFQLHKVYLVAFRAQVVAQLDDSLQIDSVFQDAVHIAHDDAQQVDGFYRSINSMAFVILYLSKTAIQKTVVHANFSLRNVAEVLHHLGNLLHFEGCHWFQFFIGSEILGTQFDEKITL